MNKNIPTIGSWFVACLALGLLAPQGMASLDADPGFSLGTNPTIISDYRDILAHSNQGGKRKQKIFRFNLAGRSMPGPNPVPDGGTGGLLIEFKEPTLPIIGSIKDIQNFNLDLAVVSLSEGSGGTSSGLVPAPGGLLLLGLGALGRRRNERPDAQRTMSRSTPERIRNAHDPGSKGSGVAAFRQVHPVRRIKAM